ncbi:MAG: RNA polymerase sigma factor [Clostridia bacterium]|nr:RNA polymerase sigma factor [Clostridia bacterium]
MGMEWEFERIYTENYRHVYAFLMKLCHDPNTAEDLTQETFYQAYISLPSYNGRCEMFTWLAAIAQNQYFKHMRRHIKEALLMDLYETEPNAPESDEPAYNVLRDVEIERVRKAISALPPKYSEVLILRIYGELPYEEISKKLGISVNSAKVIFFRAKNFLKEKLIDD